MALLNITGSTDPNAQGWSPFIEDTQSLNMLPGPLNVTGSTDPNAQGWGSQPSGYSAPAAPAFDWQGLLGGITDSSQNAAANAYTGRKSSILDFIGGLKSGQGALDERGVQNELGYKQGYGSIMDMVGRGLQSGGVMLANRNAGDSSAAEGLARAYGSIGGRNLNQIGNQRALEDRNIGMAQTDFNNQRATGLRKFDEDKTMKVNQIVGSAQEQLNALQADMQGASITDQLNIQQQIDQITQQTLATLSQYDDYLATKSAAVNPASDEANRATAFGLASEGFAAQNPFDFTAEMPAQFQGSGPFAASYPFFSSRRREA